MRRVQDYGPAPLDEPDAYPGIWPRGAVMVDGGAVLPFDADPTMPHLMTTDRRTPIVAYGSNACPAQLDRKDLGGPAAVLTPTVLRNHLVVYSGHTTRYGSVPATIVRWPGATCEVFLLWLNAVQHARLDVSEDGNYDRVMLPTDDGLIAAYRARTGFTMTGRRQPVRVAGIPATGPSLPVAMTQLEVRMHRRAIAG